ncbi:uncharacterized protein LOC110449596 [Mizuhopecten yessoensis]|uniref:uncharacterized protein LOC110449596 n=1 Tax=Mizuhopecten yessoensis TaxID=6573 RepID=UPI000B457FEB|nr:uncharacterized protein LOC110449596 [Mizuhopecten yessoensis]
MVLNRIRISLVVFVFYVFIVCGHCKHDSNKRILLNDPDYIHQLITHLQGELQTLQVTVETQTGEIFSLKTQLSQSNNVGGGSTFVRWGRTDCPANLTELVYSGYAGGSWYDHSGAAVDYLCLPPDPECYFLCFLCNDTGKDDLLQRLDEGLQWVTGVRVLYAHVAASQYVCVDKNAQPLVGGANSDDNGKMFLGVKAFCGSLRCPPYQQDKFISCVVCMK